MAFSIFKKRTLRLSDLSENDKKDLFFQRREPDSAPDIKERTFIENRLSVPITRLADFQSFLDAGCKNVWASFRACHLVASTLISAQMKVLQRDKKGNATELDPNHPLAVFMRTPNPFDSFEEMQYMWTFHMKLCGTAYWLKDEMNGKGQPLAIYPLLPQYMEAVPDAKTKVSAWRYRCNGQILTYTPDQIIQFRRPHPTNTIMGLGDVEGSQNTFNAHLTRGSLGEKFLANGAQPSGILTRKDAGEDEAQWAALKAKWNKEYGGKDNAGKTAFLSGEWEYQRLGLTMQEMQNIEQERWSIEQIFLCHGVPLSIAGLKDAANYATAKQDAINFKKNECIPLLDLLVGRLNMGNGLAQSFGEGLCYDYAIDGLIDVEQMSKDYAALVRLGAMTPNDLREQCGLPRSPDPYLDQYFVESNLIPLTMAGAAGTTNPAQTTKALHEAVTGVRL